MENQTPTRVLVVDDDHEIRSLLADYLDTHGFRAFTASDGAGMQRMLDANKVDLVVLDLTLPGEDGLTLCRNLRSSSNLPVIILTARGDPVDRILGLEMGADDYLTKPFERASWWRGCARCCGVPGHCRRTSTRRTPPPCVLPTGRSICARAIWFAPTACW